MKTNRYVYVLFRETGEPLYIGKGVRNRWDHASRAARESNDTHLHRALIDIQQRGFEVPKVKVREGLTDVDSVAIEIALIAAIGREPNGPLINQTRGGDGLVDAPQELYDRIGAKLKGRSNIKLKGVKKSPEHAKKCRAAFDAARPAANAANRGKKRSAETRKKMSDRKRGKIWITNEMTSILIGPDDPIPDGWRRGSPKGKRAGVIPYVMTNTIRDNMSAAKTGAKWYTNGVNSKLVHIGHEPPNDWRLGRASRKYWKKEDTVCEP
jgi:hypothetical protein